MRIRIRALITHSAEAAVNSAVTSGDRLPDSAATGSGSVPTSKADPNAVTATGV
ncbi:hypothetical protein [Amycolatopsis thermophila]|uniref:Uncharacterized protein n=1 Tax=Amycolatopsis thermophila TaxID=206084 RepID=A0ABU0F5X7_9PSEU|nr:hypothetical protein [Amycolatopsis thermophila]MDQ0382996.1 hypothetical protein [Amycolatopsis thermophila]